MSASPEILSPCASCGLLSEKLAALQNRLSALESSSPSANPYLLSAEQRTAAAASLAKLPLAQRAEFDQFERHRRRGAIFAILGRLRILMKELDLNSRDIARALEVAPSVISQWHASGQMGEEYRRRVKRLLQRHGCSMELSVDEVRVWEDKYLIAWIHRDVLSLTTGSSACVDDLELLCLKHSVALGWHPQEGSRAAYDRLPRSLREFLPLLTPAWFSGVIESYGLATLLLIWKLVYDRCNDE